MTPILVPGMASDRVGGLQRLMVALGHYSGRIDGIYGPVTKRAVTKLQGQVGVPRTGIVDLDTALATRRHLGRIGMENA